MKGVTIINETKGHTMTNIELLLDGFVTFIMGVFAFYDFCCNYILAGCMCTIAFACFLMFFIFGSKNTITQYEALIDKDNLDKNFIDVYDIVDKRGDIYIIERIKS